jgi:hypothetical protein
MIRTVRLYLVDLAERVGATAAETFLATLIAAGVGGLTDTSVLQKAAIAGLAAGLAVLKGIIGKYVGDRSSASLAPSIAVDPIPTK